MLIKTAQFLSRWPLLLLHTLGLCLGWLVFLLSPRYRATFLGMTATYARHQKLSAWRLFVIRCRAVGHAGKTLMELPFIWFAGGKREAVFSVRKHDWHVIDQAIEAGKGILFMTPHLGCFEVVAQKCAEDHPITVLYRPHRKPAMQALIEASRSRGNLAIAPTDMSGVRKLLRALKKGEAVGLLPDQVPSNGEGVLSTFFGQPAYTMTLPAKLQSVTGATIVFVVGERLSFGRGFVMHCYPGPQTLPDDLQEATAVINQCIEDLIAQFPEQYMWGYNRFKLPKGVQSS